MHLKYFFSGELRITHKTIGTIERKIWEYCCILGVNTPLKITWPCVLYFIHIINYARKYIMCKCLLFFFLQEVSYDLQLYLIII